MPAVTGQDVKVWQKVFQELIQEVKPSHRWTLTLDKGLVPGVLQPGWAQYQQWAFARFKCSLCSRSWASAQVCVLSHMHWSARESKGQVKMRIFAQRCKKCSQPPFEVPEFTEENTSRILNNLVLRILRSCYREGSKSVQEIPTIKDVTLEGPHDRNNCEACLQGSCAQTGLDLVKQSPMSPPLPAISSPNGRIPTNQPSTRSTTTGDAATRNAWVEKEKVLPNPWFPEPPLARSPRANNTYGTESIIDVSSVGNSDSHTAQNRTPCYSNSGCKISNICCCSTIICGCSIIIILIVVLWWLFS